MFIYSRIAQIDDVLTCRLPLFFVRLYMVCTISNVFPLTKDGIFNTLLYTSSRDQPHISPFIYQEQQLERVGGMQYLHDGAIFQTS